ncbi:MAG: hypothetical protein IM572_06715 [Chitinophagaceae bacterium]|nr:hypothetical protein [Chitinophagaceae bacterium]MCA6513570.1 hypothetical protein [Chitinophagaceae bacterium]
MNEKSKFFFFFLVLSYSQVIGQNKSGKSRLDSARSTIATLSWPNYDLVYIKIVDGIQMDPEFMLPIDCKVIQDYKIAFDSTLISLGFENFLGSNSRPKQLRVINSNLTSNHHIAYQKCNNIPGYADKINIPLIIGGNLVLPQDYETFKKKNISAFRHFSFLTGKDATKLYDSRLIFGVIVITP